MSSLDAPIIHYKDLICLTAEELAKKYKIPFKEAKKRKHENEKKYGNIMTKIFNLETQLITCKREKQEALTDLSEYQKKVHELQKELEKEQKKDFKPVSDEVARQLRY